MEITLLTKSALRIKGKTCSFVVNPQETVQTNAFFFLYQNAEFTTEDAVVLNGPGEYEIGGVKITGLRNETKVLYGMNIDGLEITIGSLTVLSAMHNKLKENNIVIVNCDEITETSFLTALAVNTVLFYGEKAEEVSQTFAKEKVQKMNKYTASLGKLPAEMETVLLQ